MGMFAKATKKKARLRLAIAGASGSGKTFTALTVGKHIGNKMAVIDTERGSASKYAGDVADFDACDLEHFAVQKYLQAIKSAAEAGYDVLVIDSLSHAWAGKGGILEEADKRGGKFGAWRDLTPLQQSLMDAILSYPGHVIATMRSKMAYEVTTDESKGRKETKVEKIGLAHVQRDDVSYEFDVMLDMDEKNNARVTKTRCPALTGLVLSKPGKDLAETLLAWLSDGDSPTPPKDQPKPTQTTEAVAQTGATEEPARDIEWWQRQHNDLCDRAFNAKGIVSGPQDANGLHVPSLDVPKFSAQARKYAGLAFDDEKVPAGYLREVIWSADNFATQKPDVRLWVSYLVSRHEIRKLVAVAMAAEAGFVPDPAAQAAADGEAAQ